MRPEDETPDPPKQMSLSGIKSKLPIDVKQRETLVSHAGRQLERSLTYVKQRNNEVVTFPPPVDFSCIEDPTYVKQRETLVSHAGRQLERSLTYVKAIGIGLCGVCIGYGLHYFINSGNSDVIVTVLQDLPTATTNSREPTTMVMSMFGGLFVR